MPRAWLVRDDAVRTATCRAGEIGYLALTTGLLAKGSASVPSL